MCVVIVLGSLSSLAATECDVLVSGGEKDKDR